jgi:uncharacterized Rossmann fold enzyme
MSVAPLRVILIVHRHGQNLMRLCAPRSMLPVICPSSNDLEQPR